MIRDFVLVGPEGQVLGRRRLDEADVPPSAALAAHKPRYLPIITEDPPAYTPGAEVLEGPAEQVDMGEMVVRRVWTVRPASAEELEALRAQKVTAIKAEAHARVLALMPEHHQRNSLALGMEMVTTHGPDPAAWPPEMAARYQADLATWDQIKAIRARSDALEAALPEDPAQLAAFEPAAADWGQA